LRNFGDVGIAGRRVHLVQPGIGEQAEAEIERVGRLAFDAFVDDAALVEENLLVVDRAFPAVDEVLKVNQVNIRAERQMLVLIGEAGLVIIRAFGFSETPVIDGCNSVTFLGRTETLSPRKNQGFKMKQLFV
jgi:hypothetical protein